MALSRPLNKWACSLDLNWPTSQRTDRKKWRSSNLGHFSVTIHCTLCNTDEVPPLLFAKSNPLKKKYNLSSFHSFSLVHLHLSSYLLYASDRPEGTSTPLTRWSSDGEARGVQQFFSPTLPSSYCQWLLSHKDIWMNQYTHRLGKGSSTPPPFQTHTHHHDPL